MFVQDKRSHFIDNNAIGENYFILSRKSCYLLSYMVPVGEILEIAISIVTELDNKQHNYLLVFWSIEHVFRKVHFLNDWTRLTV